MLAFACCSPSWCLLFGVVLCTCDAVILSELGIAAVFSVALPRLLRTGVALTVLRLMLPQLLQAGFMHFALNPAALPWLLLAPSHTHWWRLLALHLLLS